MDSVALENPKRDPEPILLRTNMSLALPENLKRPPDFSTLDDDSVALENPKRDPEPI